jgi:hypothetical protein
MKKERGLRSGGSGGQEIPPSPLGRSIASEIVYSGILSSHCGCVMALRRVKIYLVWLEVAGALTTTPARHGNYVTILGLCCALTAGVEISSYACAQKKINIMFTVVCV